MSKEIKRRLSRLEKLLIPPEQWEILVTYPDGHTETMTAQAFEALTEQEPNVDGIYTKISGNVKEAHAFFNAVRNIACHEYGEGER